MAVFVPFVSDDQIVAIGRGLIARSVPKSEWTHAAHFAATMWLLVERPDVDLCRDLPGLIRAYNESIGGANTDTSGYHETITQASIRAARAFLAERPGKFLFSVCNELMCSPLGKSDWLMVYWSRPLLFSVEARREWVEPDIKELPF